MPAGLQVFRANGSLKLDITTSITRYLGQFNTGTAAGQFVDSRLTGGRPFFQVISLGYIGQYMLPEISFGSDRFYWNFANNGLSTPNANCTVFYGVY